MVVQDNGKGISAAEVTGMNSLGLLGMRERTLGRGSTVATSEEVRKGTTVVARVPREYTGNFAVPRLPAQGGHNGDDEA